MSGDYLLVSVKHIGGWEGGAYSYRNEFSAVRAEPEIYAPPLRTPVPRIDGVTTALVGATGDFMPTLDEYGHYNVNMPFVLTDDQNDACQGVGDYGRSKLIRVAQPSGGMSGGQPYGIHFPSKRGAEMVLAYVDGNPDKPLGLGYVPNGAAPSVTRRKNNLENVIRSWGGNELVMDDTDGKKHIKMTTPDKRYVELHDGDELVRLRSEHCEMLFSDADKFAQIDAGGHTIHINYKDGEGNISVTTVKKHVINISDKNDEITVKTANDNIIIMNDPNDVISIQNASKDGDKRVNTVVLDGKNQVISLDSKDNTVVLNGKDNKITVESADSKGVFDGKGNTIFLNAKNDICLQTDGKIIFDAKKGISNRGAPIKMEN